MSILNTVRRRKAIVEYSVVQLIPLGVDKGRHQYMFPRCATGSEKPQRNIVFRFLTKSIEMLTRAPRTGRFQNQADESPEDLGGRWFKRLLSWYFPRQDIY